LVEHRLVVLDPAAAPRERLATLLAVPARLALLEECADAFPGLGRRAHDRDALRRVLAHGVVDRSRGDAVEEILRRGLRARSAGEERFDEPGDRGIERRLLAYEMHEPEAMRFGGIEALGREEVALRRAPPDGGDDVRADHGGNDPEAH